MNPEPPRARPNGQPHVRPADNDIRLSAPLQIEPDPRPVVITGGAGFIGTNVAHRYLAAGQPVRLFDNLSRPGVEHNLNWLRATHGDRVDLIEGDVQDARALRAAVKTAGRVFHFAAQVAVTTSLVDPLHDFEVNARGTLNLLEALRALDDPPPLVFTSTNKVYGDLGDVRLRITPSRYEPEDGAVRTHGFSEDMPLRFHSPYGCSKGAACQYVLDYARTFGLPAVVFRMSCIYGWHQFGNEDQGWVAHFLIRALEHHPITIYGDGRQVRDILFIDDLIDAFLLAQRHIGVLRGQPFNLGGGPANTISLLELVETIRELGGRPPRVEFDAWRAADQRYYVSDTRRFSAATGWAPRVRAAEGVARLYQWLQSVRRPEAQRHAAVAATKTNGHTKLPEMAVVASRPVPRRRAGLRHHRPPRNGKPLPRAIARLAKARD